MEQAKINPIEDQRKAALKHYQEASNAIHHWSGFVEAAIKAYNPQGLDGLTQILGEHGELKGMTKRDSTFVDSFVKSPVPAHPTHPQGYPRELLNDFIKWIEYKEYPYEDGNFVVYENGKDNYYGIETIFERYLASVPHPTLSSVDAGYSRQQVNDAIVHFRKHAFTRESFNDYIASLPTPPTPPKPNQTSKTNSIF